MFDSYVQLARGLLGELSGFCLLDDQARVRGASGAMALPPLLAWIGSLGWNGIGVRQPTAVAHTPGEWITAMPLEHNDTTLLGIVCVQQYLPILPTYPARHALEVSTRLKPLLDCIQRESAATIPVREQIHALHERTAELEWLLKLNDHMQGTGDEREAIRALLLAATERLGCDMGVCEIPDKRLCITFPEEGSLSPTDHAHWNTQQALRGVWRQTRQHLTTWAFRRSTPMVVNSVERGGARLPSVKILSVPVVREPGRVIGVLSFFKPPFAPNYENRHVVLARHLGKQVAAVVDLQFDLLTGLYTRAALDPMAAALAENCAQEGCCIIYFDVDHMHIVNETHGFEIGNEVLVRIADVLTQPLLPREALVARLPGDRFLVVLPRVDVKAARDLAQQVQAAVASLTIGPPDELIAVSLSGGVADLVAMPQALDRAVATAELACKSAKHHGRGRVEIYRTDDLSIVRRHADAVAIGQLRAALKNDGIQLFAQPLGPPTEPRRILLTLRQRDDAGNPVDTESLMLAAERYQLRPMIDRWLIQRALPLLAAHRDSLAAARIGVSIDLSAQSTGDASFGTLLTDLLRQAALHAECLTVMVQPVSRHRDATLDLAQRVLPFGCRIEMRENAARNGDPATDAVPFEEFLTSLDGTDPDQEDSSAVA